MLAAVPATAIVRDVIKDFHLRLADEPLSPEEATGQVRTGQEVQLSI